MNISEVEIEYQKIKNKIGEPAAKSLAEMSKIYEGSIEIKDVDTRLRKLR